MLTAAARLQVMSMAVSPGYDKTTIVDGLSGCRNLIGHVRAERLSDGISLLHPSYGCGAKY